MNFPAKAHLRRPRSSRDTLSAVCRRIPALARLGNDIRGRLPRREMAEALALVDYPAHLHRCDSSDIALVRTLRSSRLDVRSRRDVGLPGSDSLLRKTRGRFV